MGLTVVYFIAICAMYTKIRMAIRIMETAADFMTECILIVLVPPIVSVLIISWVVIWIYGFAYVFTVGEFA